MQSDAWIQLLLRTLPAILVFILGFVAAADKKTRLSWNNLLYQAGSIRPDQREDQQIGRGVKWPFFVVALFLLIWPIQYFRLATRTFEVKSDIYSGQRKPATIYDQKAGNAATNAAPEANVAANSASGTAPNTNIYGQPR